MSLFHLIVLAFALLFIVPKLMGDPKPVAQVRAQLIPNASRDGLVYTGTREYA